MKEFFYYKRMVALMCVVFFIGHIAHAQDDEIDTRPVLEPFTASKLIDNQTNVLPYQGGFQFIIYHRFAPIEKMSDLLGIYGPSNICLGVNYGITRNIMAGFATEKNNKLQVFQTKWNILNQTRSGNIPLSVTFYGNVAIDARDKDSFGKNYQFTNRLSYFGQIILSRKFNDRFSLLAGTGFSHFNALDSLIDHDKINISTGCRIRIYNQISCLLEYNQPLHIKGISEYREPFKSKAGFGFGVEFGTATHAFQVFASTFDHIIAQKNYVFNENDISDGGLRLGFNILVRF